MKNQPGQKTLFGPEFMYRLRKEKGTTGEEFSILRESPEKVMTTAFEHRKRFPSTPLFFEKVSLRLISSKEVPTLTQMVTEMEREKE